MKTKQDKAINDKIYNFDVARSDQPLAKYTLPNRTHKTIQFNTTKQKRKKNDSI